MKKWLLMILVLGIASIGYSGDMPSGRAHLGLGYTTINETNFSKVYDQNGGWAYNFGGSVKVTNRDRKNSALYVSFDYTGFKASGHAVKHTDWNTQSEHESNWQHNIKYYGLLYGWKADYSSRVYSWIGGGIASGDVTEKTSFGTYGGDGSGWYIEYGAGTANRRTGLIYDVILRYAKVPISGGTGIGGDEIDIGGFSAWLNFGIGF